MKNYQWLLFDADGTLFDYDLAEAKALQATFDELDVPFKPTMVDTYRVINHQTWQDFENGKITSVALRTARFERLFESLQMKVDTQQFSQHYLRNLADAADLMPGAAALIGELQRRFQLAIITNGLKDVQRPRLARSTIADAFAVIAISEELGAAKPDPGFFDAAFELMGKPPRESALVIGDSLTSDIQGGNQYGLDTCWFNPAGTAPDVHIPCTYQISHLADLLRLLKG